MNLRSILAFAAAVSATSLGLAGCADVAKADAAQRDEPRYRTGSNIADRQRRDLGVQTMSGEEFERGKIPQMPQPRATGAH